MQHSFLLSGTELITFSGKPFDIQYTFHTNCLVTIMLHENGDNILIITNTIIVIRHDDNHNIYIRIRKFSALFYIFSLSYFHTFTDTFLILTHFGESSSFIFLFLWFFVTSSLFGLDFYEKYNIE